MQIAVCTNCGQSSAWKVFLEGHCQLPWRLSMLTLQTPPHDDIGEFVCPPTSPAIASSSPDCTRFTTTMPPLSLLSRSRPPGLRELKCWARLYLELCGRGHEADAALAAAFAHVYVRPQLGEQMRSAALQAFKSSWPGEIGVSADPWFQPAAWPLALHTGAFAEDSELTTVTRDGSIVLFWAGREASNHLEGRHPELDLTEMPGVLACAGLAAVAMLPGSALHAGLVGLPAAALSAGHAVPLEEPWSSSRLLAALRIYAERAILPAYRNWAIMMLRQCQDVLRQLGCSNGSRQATEMCEKAAHFLGAVFSHPMHAELEGGAWSSQCNVLYGMAASAAVLEGCVMAAAAHDNATATILQLSCCRFMRPKVGVQRVSSVH